MCENALFKPSDQVDDIDARATLLHVNGRKYELTLQISAMPALASVACQVSGRTTRSIMKQNGVVLAENDWDVNVYDELMKFSEEKEAEEMEECEEGGEEQECEELEPTHVVVIIDATTLAIHDVANGASIGHQEKLTGEIDAIVKEKLSGIIICNTMLLDARFLSSLLK